MFDAVKSAVLSGRSKLEEFVSQYTAKGEDFKMKQDEILRHAIERVLISAMDSLSIPNLEQEIRASASDSVYPKTIGFITVLSRALAQTGSVTIYATKVTGGEEIYSTTKPRDMKEVEVFTIDSTFQSNGIVSAAINLIVDSMKAIATGMDLTRAILVKLEGLNEELDDNKTAKNIVAQLQKLDESLRLGKMGVVGAGSSVESLSYNIEPMQKAKEFGFQLLAFGLGYPVEFFDGIGGSTLSDTGASTEKAIHRGNTRIANMVLIPFIKERFGVQCKVKPLLSQLSDITVAISVVETSTVISYEDARLVLSTVGLEGDQKKIEKAIGQTKEEKSISAIEEQELKTVEAQ